jgi:hypothetical protein
VVWAGVTTLLPLTATLPMLLSIDPESALVDVQVRVEFAPAVIDAGAAVRVAVGTGGGGVEEDPPPQPLNTVTASSTQGRDKAGSANFFIFQFPRKLEVF